MTRKTAAAAAERRMDNRISRLEVQLDQSNALLFKIWVELKR